MRFLVCCAVATASAFASRDAAALGPEQVFERVAPSVWSLRALNAAEAPIAFGSAVVIGPGRLVTACSTLARARALELRRGNRVQAAQLVHPDVERNLCELAADGLDTPPVVLAPPGSVKVGQPAYLISVPQRLATTLGAGLIAGLGGEAGGVPSIQSTIGVGAGSAGGGLFDAEARLVGIAMPQPSGADKPGADLGFAAPADWIREIPERAAAALQRRRDARPVQGTPPGWLPAIGTTWRYEYLDRKFTMRIPFTVRVAGVDGLSVHESLQVDAAPGPQERSIAAREPAFLQRPLSAGRTLFEFAPYLLAAGEGNAPADASPRGYPAAGQPGSWRISGSAQGREPVSVPAGSFNALKYAIAGTRPGLPGNFQTSHYNPTRFAMSVWYAPEAGRYVMIRHQTWSASDVLLSDESVELQELRK